MDDRLTLRLDLGPFEREAALLGVETGGLVREAALLGLGLAVREVSAGRVRLRRRSGVPVSPGVVVEPPVPAGRVPAAPADVQRPGGAEHRGFVERGARLSRAEAFRAATSRPSGG